MNLITLHEANTGEKVFLRSRNISVIQTVATATIAGGHVVPAGNVTHIFVAGVREPFVVDETADEVKELMDAESEHRR